MDEQIQYPPTVATCSDICDVESGCSKDCSICLEPMNKPHELCKLTCNHMFHFKCCNEYFRWLYISNLDITCPLCRRVLQETTSAHYMLRRLSILQTIPNIHMQVTPPTRIVVPRTIDNCFARTVICIPFVIIMAFIITALTWTHNSRT